MTTATTAEEARDIIKGRIANGVKWLNRRYPNWHRVIKVRMFDFSDPCKCVIGQVCPAPKKSGFANFADGNLVRIGIIRDTETTDKEERGVWGSRRVINLGFDASEEFSGIKGFDVYREMGAEWVRQIALRREKR